MLLDINFGCPVKKVVSKGAGAGVFKDIDLMVHATEAVVRSTSLPVTVKTRLGWDNDNRNIEEIAEPLRMLVSEAAVMDAHMQMYKGEPTGRSWRRENNATLEFPSLVAAVWLTWKHCCIKPL